MKEKEEAEEAEDPLPLLTLPIESAKNGQLWTDFRF